MIGIFDSGIGGLSVLGGVRRLLPGADIVYVADHAAAPYGTRSLREVEARCRLVASWLESAGCGIVTIACNTASAAALHPLRRDRPAISFVGMEPAVKPAAQMTGSGRVGVVATAATFQGELFASVVDRFATGIEVLSTACPTWVELVEAGTTTGPVAEREVRRCLGPLAQRGVDVLVLACTHFPALIPVIGDVMGDSVQIVDPSPAVARQTARRARDLGHDQGSGSTRLVSTAFPSRLSTAAARLGLETDPALLPLG